MSARQHFSGSPEVQTRSEQRDGGSSGSVREPSRNASALCLGGSHFTGGAGTASLAQPPRAFDGNTRTLI